MELVAWRCVVHADSRRRIVRESLARQFQTRLYAFLEPSAIEFVFDPTESVQKVTTGLFQKIFHAFYDGFPDGLHFLDIAVVLTCQLRNCAPAIAVIEMPDDTPLALHYFSKVIL